MTKKKGLTAAARAKLEKAKGKALSILDELEEGFEFELFDAMERLDNASIKTFKANCKAMNVDGDNVLFARKNMLTEWNALQKSVKVQTKEFEKLYATIKKQLDE